MFLSGWGRTDCASQSVLEVARSHPVIPWWPRVLVSRAGPKHGATPQIAPPAPHHRCALPSRDVEWEGRIRLPAAVPRPRRLHLRAGRRELHRPGLADDEVCIGDRYQICSALFEVSQPPGQLLSPRHPQGRAADAGAARRPPPAQEGEVGAGDAIESVERGPGTMTVAEVDGLLYLPGPAQEKRCRWGAIGWSAVPNTAQDGFRRQAAAVAGSSNAVARSGR
jgi:hypothetical protein